MSFKPVFIMPNGERCKNGQAFTTEEEARSSAHSRFMRWTMPSRYEVEESDEPVSYRWDPMVGDVYLAPEPPEAA